MVGATGGGPGPGSARATGVARRRGGVGRRGVSARGEDVWAMRSPRWGGAGARGARHARSGPIRVQSGPTAREAVAAPSATEEILGKVKRRSHGPFGDKVFEFINYLETTLIVHLFAARR